MKGLKEAVKGIKFLDRDEVIAHGALCYKMGIEQRNNPRTGEGEQKLWNIGWTDAQIAFLRLFPEVKWKKGESMR
jgi:hypothetical protein